MVDMKEPQPGRLAFSVADVSDHLRVSTDTVVRRIRSGELPAKKIGARVIILAEDLKAYLEGLPKAD